MQYSLLAELSEEERLKYKGITRKKIRACVQRLVLILPVEERDQNSSPEGLAGTAHDEALESAVHQGRQGEVVAQLAQHGVQGAEGEAAGQAVQHVGQAGDQVVRQGGWGEEDHSQPVDVQEEQQVQGDEGAHGLEISEYDDETHMKEDKESGELNDDEYEAARFSRSFRERLRSCAVLESKFQFEDYE